MLSGAVIAAVLFLAWAIVVTCVSNRQAEDYENLRFDYDSLETENEDLRGKNEDLRRASESAKRDVVTWQAKHAQALDDVRLYEKKCADLDAEASTAKKCIAASDAKIANQQAIIDNLTSENERLLTENVNLSKRLEYVDGYTGIEFTETPLPESAVEMLTAKPSKSGKDWLAWLKQRNGK